MLLCAGKSAHDVYRSLYIYLKGHGVGSGYKTFVFPDYVRNIIRERFGSAGLYDEQYYQRADVYTVTTEDLCDTEWPAPPTNCYFCEIPMPDTPWTLTEINHNKVTTVHYCVVQSSVFLLAMPGYESGMIWGKNTWNVIITIIIIISTTMFMVLSAWQSHCESSPGSFDERRMAPSGRRPKTKPDDLGCESACAGCQKLHPPSPFIITQPESWYSFYRPTKGRRLSRPSWLVTYRDGLPVHRR